MSHRAFVTAWRAFGERWLLDDAVLVGSDDAWFKVCTGTRWWDDDRLPPEKPLAPPPPARYKPKKRKRSDPRKVSVRVLSGIGRDLIEWALPEDNAIPARHRDREAEFREKMKRELEQYKEWLVA